MQADKATPEEIEELKQQIDIYDSSLKTGNEALDVLLTERSLYCNKHGIRLSCMVDGDKLSFMRTGDVCALFGNALENAIEAVSSLQKEQRVISFQLRESRGMLVITVENPFNARLKFDLDLPKTTKEQPEWHGYGLKSIRLVAEKYGGKMVVAADDTFCLTVLLPLPE